MFNDANTIITSDTLAFQINGEGEMYLKMCQVQNIYKGSYVTCQNNKYETFTYEYKLDHV